MKRLAVLTALVLLLLMSATSVYAAMTLGDLEVGDRVVDNSWEWEHRTGPDSWDGVPYSGTGETKPVTWIVVAKDHYSGGDAGSVEGGVSHVTLITEEIIGKHPFDNSTDRGHLYGSNHWGDSGHPNATYGIRKFLNGSSYSGSDTNSYSHTFYDAMSLVFKSGVLSTTLPNKARITGSSYTTTDKVFLPTSTELGDTSHDNTYPIGTDWGHFTDNERRVAQLEGSNLRYWTRSPTCNFAHNVRGVRSGGGFFFSNGAYDADGGVRPALNLESGILVSAVPNEDGYYEIGIDENFHGILLAEDEGIIITGYYGAGGIIQIPSAIQGIPVVAIGEGAFYNKNLAGVTIPSSVTTIGNNAFRKNQILMVTIPGDVTRIGKHAFAENSLIQVTLGSSLTEIGDGAFQGSQLTSVNIPGNVQDIGAYAFADNQIDTLTLGGALRTIGSNAFQGNSITSLNLPDSIQTIGKYAFQGNNLTALNIPGTVNTLSENAFAGNALTSLTLNEGLITIKRYAFQDNLLTSLVIPTGVTRIEKGAFQNSQIAEATIPESVLDLELDVFDGNQELPSNLTIIGKRDSSAHILAIHKGYTFLEIVNRLLRIAVEGQGTTTPAAGDHTYPEGTEVNLTATPGEGLEFEKWVIDGTEVTDPQTTVTLDRDKSATAYFVETVIPELVGIALNPAEVIIQVGGAIPDFAVIATYDDESTADVTVDAVIDTSAVDVNVPGAYTVTATYGGMEATATVTVEAVVIPDPELESIALDPAEVTIQVGGDLPDYTVTATYDDGSTADVTADAVIDTDAVDVNEPGEYTVTATYGGMEATATVTVEAGFVLTIYDVKPDEDMHVKAGDVVEISFRSNVTGGEAYYRVQLPGISLLDEARRSMEEIGAGFYKGTWTIPENLMVEGLMIEVEIYNAGGIKGQAYAPGKITIEPEGPVGVTGITLDQGSLDLTVGAAPVTLVATVEPGDATDQEVTWSSSDPSVASVNGGIVTPLRVGDTTVTAITADGGFTAACQVTVRTSISSVEPSADLLLKAGEEVAISFQSLITGGEASFSLRVPGAVNPLGQPELSMEETGEGHYTGTWTVPQHANFQGASVEVEVYSPAGIRDSAVAQGRVSVDTLLPTITLLGDPVVYLVAGETYEEPGATARDYLDGDLTEDIIISGLASGQTVTGPRIYLVTYNVTDRVGNQAVEVTREVVVAPPAVTAEGIMETPESGSIKVTGALEGATLTLYGAGGQEVEGITLGPGSDIHTFQGVSPGEGYYVTQALNGVESAPSNTVLLGLIGDVNQDGRITIMDAVLILQYIVGLEELTPWQQALADYNQDGRITVMDAREIALYVIFAGDTGTKTYSLSLKTEPTAGGNVTGAGSYAAGAEVSLTAAANPGYTFKDWTEGGTVISTEAVFTYTMPARPVTLVANFTDTPVDVTGVTLDQATLDLAVGETGQLTATVSPANATNKSVTWTSGSPSVATVSATGTVTAVSAGTATITVTTVDGEFSATCTVNVKEPDQDPGRIFDVSGEVSAQVETRAGAHTGTYSQALVSYTLNRDGGVAISLYDAGGNIITERSGLIREAGNPYVEVFALTRLASSYSISVDGTLEIDKESFLSGDQPGPYYFGILDALVPADSAARVIKPDNGEITTGDYDITRAFANWTNQPPGKPLIINDTTGEPIPAIAHLRDETVIRSYALHPDEGYMVLHTGTDDYYELAGDVVIISYDLSVSPAVRKVETTAYFDAMTRAENADLLLSPIDGKVKLVQVYKE